MKKLIFATGNRDKMKEIRDIMDDLGFEVTSMLEEGIESDPDETGTTFEENAMIKARAVHEICVERGINMDRANLGMKDAIEVIRGINDTEFDICEFNMDFKGVTLYDYDLKSKKWSVLK